MMNPLPPHPPARWRRLLVLSLLLGGLFTAALGGHPSAAAPPRYTFDTDPVRLGRKALEEGQVSAARAHFTEALRVGYQVARAEAGMAELAVLQGDPAGAELLYRKALESRAAEGGEAFPEAQAGLGLVLLQLERPREAEAQFAAALAEKPKFWPATYGQARLALSASQWERARALLDQGAGRKGRNQGEDQYHLGLGFYGLGIGDLALAEREALVALALNPADAECATLVARVYEAKGVPSLAVSAYERALAAPGATPGAGQLHHLGRIYLRANRYNDARDTFVKALAVDSTYAPAWGDLGRLYQRADKHERAFGAWTRYLELMPDDATALAALSNSALALGRSGPALEAAGRALEVDSTRVESRLAYARAGLKSRDPQVRGRAGGLFSALPDSLTGAPEDRVLLAGWQVEMKRYADAESTLAAVLREHPERADAHYQAGMAALGAGNPESAVDRLREAGRLDSTSALYQLNLGVALFQAKQTRLAIPIFRRTLLLNDGLTVARVMLAQALLVSDSLATAEAEYRKVLEAEPQNGRALRGLGFCAIRKRRYQEAARWYRASTTAEPGNADGWAGLGNANLGLGELDGAAEAFRRARAIDPSNSTLRKGQELLDNARKAAGGQ